jgi:hypothetical protein
MRVIIAGSRTIMNYKYVEEAVKQSGYDIDLILQGGAKGVDFLAFVYAKNNKIPCLTIKADWKCWGKSAGYRRNEHMARNADALIAVWDGVSKGTSHMINIAYQHQLKVFIFRTDTLFTTASESNTI